MNSRNKAKVLALYPDALLHRWNGRLAVSVDRNGLLILGIGNDPTNTWQTAMRRLRNRALIKSAN